MIDYATPLLLTLCGIGLVVIGAFFYEIGRSDERAHAKQEYDAENAKLREQGERLFDKTLELKDENDKLRKFATEAWELLTCNEPVFVWSGLQEKARELGIEADE